jgi:hypothetical protein
VPVGCGRLVLPINQSRTDTLDDRFVRRALHVHDAQMTVVVDFDSAGNLPMPARDGRFHGIDCAADIVTSRRGIPVATLGDFASFAVLHKEFTGGGAFSYCSRSQDQLTWLLREGK